MLAAARESKDAVMGRLLGWSLLAGLMSLSSGCAICCAPFDYNYLVTGGRWTRYNPSSGRVGSAFDEAGGPSDVAVVSAAGEPTPAQPAQQAGPSQLRPGQPMRGGPTYGTQVTTPRDYGSPVMVPTDGYGNSAPMMGSRQPAIRMAPGTRSVIPRDMGNNYLPSGE
jgi:hypothetical protein